jgi:hypothetical protein
MLRPVALCDAHRIEVALTVVPELLRDQLAAALRGMATQPAARTELVETARAAMVEDLLHGVHDSVVYFIANGGRVKIGYTANLKSRLGSLALRRDAVLLALRGGPELERALHAHFAAYRNGNTEWFDLSPEIFRYIAAPHPSATGAVLRRDGVAGQVGMPIIADLVREQVASTTNNTDAINNVMAALPDANRDSVAAAVRRARRKAGPYL